MLHMSMKLALYVKGQNELKHVRLNHIIEKYKFIETTSFLVETKRNLYPNTRIIVNTLV